MSDRFKYSAVTAEGQRKKGILSAESADQVEEFLGDQGLLPLQIDRIKVESSFSFWGFSKGTNYEDLITFTSSLSTLFRAGIPILRTLSLIRIGPPESRFNQALDQIKFQMQSGQSLSQAMSEFEDIFPAVYLASIAAGEESGKLDNVLDELSPILEGEMELMRQIKSGIRYPIMVILALVSAFVVMMTFVVPKFMAFYSAFGSKLPLPTRILIYVSDLFTTYWPLIPVVILLAAYIFHKIIQDEKRKLAFDRRLLKLPVLGDLAIKGNVARFALMFTILEKAGLPIIKSLDLLRRSVKNSAIGFEITLLKDLLERGREEYLTKHDFQFFPEMSLQMIKIGLESGSLEKMLSEIGRHYSKEVQYKSRQLTAILEPILTVGLGIFVLLLALAVFLPMWNLLHVFRI